MWNSIDRESWNECWQNIQVNFSFFHKVDREGCDDEDSTEQQKCSLDPIRHENP